LRGRVGPSEWGWCDVDGVREELLHRNLDYGDALGNAMYCLARDGAANWEHMLEQVFEYVKIPRDYIRR